MPEPVNPAEAIADPIEAAIRESIDGVEPLSVDAVVDEQPVVETAEPAVVEPVVDAPVVAEKGEKPVVAAEPVKPAAAVVADESDISKVPERGANGRINTIPQPRVVKMVESSVKRAKTEWETTTLKPLEAKVSTYETRLKSIGDTERLMFGADDKGNVIAGEQGLALKRTFLQQLANAVPGYAELLRGADLGLGEAKPAAGSPAAAAAALAAINAEDPEPTPDVLDANNKPIGWSEAGLAKMRAWDRRTAAREAVAEAESAIVKKYGLDKISGRFNEVEGQRNKLSSIEQQIDTASRTWPGFNENAAAITDTLVANAQTPNYGLREAYNQTMYTLAKGRTTSEQELETSLRTRIAEELRNAPRSTSTATASISTRAAEDIETTGDEVGDAIRRSIKGKS